MKLISMANSPAEAKEQVTYDSTPPKYPYGLSISLNDETLKKLGITELPKVGAPIMITAKCEVCAVSAYDSQQGGAEANVSLQITDMAIEGESKPAEQRLYGKG